MIDTDMTSDFFVYNCLKSSDDEFIKKCNVKFIDKSVPATEDNTIYVASVDLETHKETFDTSEYRALVNVYVKTKDTDYVTGSRFLRTVVKHIKHVLREDEDCKGRHITFRNITRKFKHSICQSTFTMINMCYNCKVSLEVESKSLEDEFSCINDVNAENIDIKVE